MLVCPYARNYDGRIGASSPSPKRKNGYRAGPWAESHYGATLLHCLPSGQGQSETPPSKRRPGPQKAIRHPPKAGGLIKPPRCSADRVLDDLVTILSPTFPKLL